VTTSSSPARTFDRYSLKCVFSSEIAARTIGHVLHGYVDMTTLVFMALFVKTITQQREEGNRHRNSTGKEYSGIRMTGSTTGST
jgi:hypothetical protein